MRAVVSLAAFAAACGTSEPKDYPQVLNRAGGPVLASPHVVPVFFAGDPDVASIEDFLRRLGPSDYWAATTSEYGVGPIRLAPAIVMTDAPATIDFDDVQGWLLGAVGGEGWPPVDADTIFALLFPKTSIAMGGCTQFGGYHQEIQRPGDHSIVYAVIVRCPAAGDQSSLDRVTSFLSHELIEASTDPLVESQPAFSGVDAQHAYWTIRAGGGELTDLCELAKNQAQRLVGPYLVQRSWSNEAALAGDEPCVP